MLFVHLDMLDYNRSRYQFASGVQCKIKILFEKCASIHSREAFAPKGWDVYVTDVVLGR